MPLRRGSFPTVCRPPGWLMPPLLICLLLSFLSFFVFYPVAHTQHNTFVVLHGSRMWSLQARRDRRERSRNRFGLSFNEMSRSGTSGYSLPVSLTMDLPQGHSEVFRLSFAQVGGLRQESGVSLASLRQAQSPSSFAQAPVQEQFHGENTTPTHREVVRALP